MVSIYASRIVKPKLASLVLRRLDYALWLRASVLTAVDDGLRRHVAVLRAFFQVVEVVIPERTVIAVQSDDGNEKNDLQR